jgi:hypothetical protein
VRISFTSISFDFVGDFKSDRWPRQKKRISFGIENVDHSSFSCSAYALQECRALAVPTEEREASNWSGHSVFRSGSFCNEKNGHKGAFGRKFCELKASHSRISLINVLYYRRYVGKP